MADEAHCSLEPRKVIIHYPQIKDLERISSSRSLNEFQDYDEIKLAPPARSPPPFPETFEIDSYGSHHQGIQSPAVPASTSEFDPVAEDTRIMQCAKCNERKTKFCTALCEFIRQPLPATLFTIFVISLIVLFVFLCKKDKP